jgi:hypothetical protein
MTTRMLAAFLLAAVLAVGSASAGVIMLALIHRAR